MPQPADGRSDGGIAERAHIPALDGLRGIAILLVIPHNADIFSGSAAWLWPFAQVAHAGWLGVQLFFVLSGFLITRNLIDSRGAPNYFTAFFGRRALRIFPLYYLTLLVALVVLPHLVTFSPETLASHRHQVWLWTFLTNWAQPFGADVAGFSHFWSLAVEEQFYLIWPLVVFWLPPSRLFSACVLVALAAVTSRAWMMHAGASDDMVYMFTNCRMDALALGAGIAALSASRAWIEALRRHERSILTGILVVLVATAAYSHIYSTFDPHTLLAGQSILAAAFAMLIACLVSAADDGTAARLRDLLSARWLRTFGRVSFAMYVFHLPILAAFGNPMREALAFSGSALPLCFALSAVLSSFIAGWLSYHLVEKHFLKLKSRIAPATVVRGAAT